MLQIYFVCLTYLLIVTDTVRCKPDYIYNNEAGGWLKLQAIPTTWEEAMLRCHGDGAVLASPLDKQLVTALTSLMEQYADQMFYLGTHDLHAKGDFGSIEGVPLSDMEINWGTHPTIFHNGSCLTMSVDGTEHYNMYISSCSDPLPYICYKKLGNDTMNECGTFDNEYHLNERTGSCYKVHQQQKSWVGAYSICASEGGYLVILNDEEEARIVKDLFPVRSGDDSQWDWESFHVGLRDWGDDTWITIHGERIEDVFHDWSSGQPDNADGIQHTGSFMRAGTLDDVWYGYRAMFVCEKSPKSIRFDASPSGEEELPQL